MSEQTDLPLVEAMPESELDEPRQLEIVYDGPAIANGEIRLAVLAEGLKGFSDLCSRVSVLLLGTSSECDLVLARPFEIASVHTFVEILSRGLGATEAFLASKHMDAIERLCTFLGLGLVTAKPSLLSLFQKRKGRSVESGDELVEIVKNAPFHISAELFLRIFNDPQVQAAIRRLLQPLREDGIEVLETRRNRRTNVKITKAEVQAADAAELEDVTGQTEEVLNIEKIALLPHLAWHFSNRDGAFDAKIEDSGLLARVSSGELFGYGDKMKVLLSVTATRTTQGKLVKVRVIPKVFSVEHASPRILEGLEKSADE